MFRLGGKSLQVLEYHKLEYHKLECHKDYAKKIMLKMESRLQKYVFWIEKSFSILGGGGYGFQIGRNCILDSESFSHFPEMFSHLGQERR